MLIDDERKLATIQEIISVEPIEGADRISKATILGWELVVKKGEFAPKDKCVYFEIDSVLPDKPVFEFMRGRKFRVKTAKFRKCISQGLALKVEDVLPDKVDKHWTLGQDVTKIIGVTLYEPGGTKDPRAIRDRKPKNPILRFLYRFKFFRLFISPRASKFPFPSHLIPKTDEPRVQGIPQIIPTLVNKILYVTEKIDGQSGTYVYYKKKFYVCSRNMCLPKDNSNWWQMVEKYKIKEILVKIHKEHGIWMGIQGEIVGPGVQGNKYKLDSLQLFVFNIYDVVNRQYLPYYKIKELTGLEPVPLLDINLDITEHTTVKDIVELSKGKSVLNPKIYREGIVIRNVDLHKNKISFKAVNPKFLLKYDQ